VVGSRAAPSSSPAWRNRRADYNEHRAHSSLGHLTPRHALGVVTTVEQEGRSRLGLELYYTGRQALEDDPYRAESRPYLVVGLLGERAFATPAGVARAFVNLENLTNVRQTRFDPLLLPGRGRGGRWTTDVWSLLEGRTVNAGVRLGF